MKVLLLTLLLTQLCVAAPLKLQSHSVNLDLDAVRYRFAPVTGHRGLDLTNSAVVSDNKGFLWVGTQDGLIRLDAYESKRFGRSNKNENTIAGNFITALAFQESTQSLWIGTVTGLSRYHLPTETFTNFVHSNAPDSISSQFIQSLLVDQKGYLWIGTRQGLNRFNQDKGNFIRVTLNDNASIDKTNSSIVDIQQHMNGDLWVASRNELFTLKNGAVKRSYSPFHSSQNIRQAITKILFENEDNIWLGTEQNGLSKFRITNEKLSSFTREKTEQKLPSNYIRSLMMTRNKQEIWVGTDGGLSIYNIENQSFLPVQGNDSINESIVAFHEDNHGIIWVGTWSKGLHLYNPNETQIGRLSRQQISDSDENLRTIVKGKDDDIWFSSYKTLFQLQTEDNLLTKYDISPINQSKNRAISIWNTNTNTLYLLTKDLYEITSSGLAKKFSIPKEISHLSWYGASFDSKGQLWLRSRTLGIYCLEPSLKTVIHHIPASISGFAKQIDHSMMVFGSLQASYFVDINTFETFTHDQYTAKGMLNVNITGYHRDKKNRVWAGTSGGIHELIGSIQKPKYKVRSTDDGMPTDVLTGPLSDKHEQLWFSSTDGLIRFNPVDEKIMHFDIQTGALSNYSIGQYTKDENDRLYFLGPAGITVIDQSTITESSLPYQTIIKDVLIKSSRSRQESVNQLLPGVSPQSGQVIKFRKTLTLPAAHRDFSIVFTTPYMGRSNDVSFFYRLKGFDDGWNEANSNNRRATYTNLEPGTYSFEVRTRNINGVDGPIDYLTITLHPNFFETLWFQSITILFFITVLVGWYKYRVFKIKQYNLLLEKQVEQRTNDINTLADIGRDITSLLNVDELSEKIYHHLNQSLNINVLAIGIYQSGKQRIKFERTFESGKPLPSFYKPMDTQSELAAWSIHHNKEVVLNNYFERYRYLSTEPKSPIGERMETVVYIPIISRNQTKLGCLTIQSIKKFAFSDDDLEFIRTITNYISIALDNAMAHHALKRASFTDYLTKLPNRRAFLEQARYQIKVDDRSNQPLSFAIADIDHFKKINDTYGHEAGDSVLQKVASIFTNCLRSQDLIARWGGEEFVFMFPNTKVDGAKLALQKIRLGLLSETFELKSENVSVTVTFGICSFSHGQTIEEVIDQADSALYQGKHTGRNKIIVKEPDLKIEEKLKAKY